MTAHRGEELVAVFPLQFQKYDVKFLRPRLLGTIEDGELQLSDFIFAHSAANRGLFDALTDWLRRQKHLAWDELRLRKVREDSAIAFSANACLPRGTLTLRNDGSAYFDTRGSYDLATQAMSGTFKRNLRRLSRRAEESAPLRFQSYRRPGELDQAFEIFLEIEASGWKGSTGTVSAIRCRPAALAFYTGLVREFALRDACVINLLWHGEQPVAGQFCLKFGKVLNVLKIGFSDAHASFAPGNLLLDRAIRQACDDVETYTLSLVNEPSWARNFKPLTLGVWTYNSPNWSLRGLLVHMALVIKRTRDAWKKQPAAAAVREDA